MEQTAIERFLIYIKQERLRQIGVDAVLTVKRKEPKNERMDQRQGQAAGGWRICGLHSKKKSILQIYANGSKNREKWLGKSDN